MPIPSMGIGAKMEKQLFLVLQCFMVVGGIAMFRGSSERSLLDISDEPMYAII